MEQPRIYSIAIFRSEKVSAATINKVFFEVFRYDLIYTGEKLIELNNKGLTKVGAYSADIAQSLIFEINKISKDLKVELSEVMLCNSVE